jgi:hypothetical protein
MDSNTPNIIFGYYEKLVKLLCVTFWCVFLNEMFK